MKIETIVDMQSWCRTWPLNISVQNKNFTGNSKKLASLWSPTVSQKSLTLTIPWNSAKPVKTSPGIIARLHHTDQKRMGLLKEQCAEYRKAPLAVLLQSCLNESWWADSMECHTYLRNVTDLLSDGKTPYERRLWATI